MSLDDRDTEMSITESRSHSHTVDVAPVDSDMSGTVSICTALVVVLIVYVLGVAVLQPDTVAGPSQHVSPTAMSFLGP